MRGRSSGRTASVWLARLVLVAAVLAVFFLKPLAAYDRTTDTATIDSFDVAMELSEDGTLTSDERITVQLPGGKRGIFRVFDIADPRRADVEHPVEVFSISRDGEPEEYVELDGAPGTKNIRIGNENVILTPGAHTYEIVSETTDVFEAGDEGETLWWWDVVGSGWQMPMDSVSVTAELPAVPTRVECVQGEDTPCDATVSGTTLTVETGPLEPYTPVTVRTTFPSDVIPAPEGAADSGTITWILTILAGLLAAGAAFALHRATTERTPGLPVVFEPPEGVSPALGVRVLDEQHSSDDLQATFYDLAERGVLRLEGDDSQWMIHRLAEPPSVPLSSAELAVLTRLGLSSAGATFHVTKSESAGKALGEATTALRGAIDSEAAPYLSSSTPGCLAKGLGAVCALATLVMAGVYLFGNTGWVVWPLLVGVAVFAVASMGMLLDPGVNTVRTAQGRELWSRTGGFARFLTTDSAESRFEAAKHLDWYPRYLAWALALGSADAWAKRFEEQGVAVPTPPWILWHGVGTTFSPHRMGDSFNSAIVGASAAYAASQAASASSGGGGGFSGGSGGGGGGGGSW